MEITVEVYCDQCNGTEFRLEQKCTGDSEKQIYQNKYINHDGWGWELEYFDFICLKGCKKSPCLKVRTK